MAKRNQKIKISLLGGLNEIGKNMTMIEYKGDIVIIDCGLIFPEDEMLGIDIVIPDVSYLVKNKDKIKALLVTHGHEDHIGAIPYLLKKINVPIYTMKFTLGLIKLKIKEHNLSGVDLHEIQPRQKISLGAFDAEFIRVNHSIPDSCSIALHTDQGIIFHTGDFKIDFTPIDKNRVDLTSIAQIGSKGVICMLGESTNVELPGYTESESAVGTTLSNIFQAETENRIFVATFASNVHRLQQIIDAAYKNGRKVAVSGRSLANILAVASEFKYINIPEGTYIDLRDINKYQDNELVIITTGSQGEPLAALTRMSKMEHRQVEIKDGDVVIFSAHPIPGNEKLVSRVINALFERGAKVIYDSISEIHVSGHARQEELKLMLSLVKPKYFVPIHGERRHLIQHKKMAEKLGIPSENIFLMYNGDTLEIDRDIAQLGNRIQAGSIMVDGLGVGDVGNIVLRDRKHLSEDGLIVIVIPIDETENIQDKIEIISRGFVYVRESEKLMDEIKALTVETVKQCISKNNIDRVQIKNAVKENLKYYLFEKTKRDPMILPIIID
ncbi:ribonuclease J [Criibacterium bergeronii]|uniref:Ribonuclease J n=1 Tax=Criibacterium bergeronii TaxID=1871336 RepID=A0A371IMI8_9FIRM|nr:ribonuclease J [Criibacterium bergeronii]MBS6062339.1 ribonuclease J [Peptostreptococcaceae bacterium]RDY21688.1 ribonuclease J [Criibacterium bergeronii]